MDDKGNRERIPIWKSAGPSPRDSTIRDWLRRWARHGQNRLPAIAFLLIAVWTPFLFLSRVHPPTGTYAVFLAFLAVVETIWPPDRSLGKALWVVVFLYLLVCEIGNLYRDREENRNALSRVSSASEEAASFASGGSTYPVVFPGIVSQTDGARQVGFYLSKQGEYSLYSLSVNVGRPFRVSLQDKTIQTFGMSRQFPELDINASYPLLFQPIPREQVAYYAAFMSARNGSWEEIIELRKQGTRTTWRILLLSAERYGISPSKPLVDLADEDFPESERHRTISPLDALDLPFISESRQNAIGPKSPGGHE